MMGYGHLQGFCFSWKIVECNELGFGIDMCCAVIMSTRLWLFRSHQIVRSEEDNMTEQKMPSNGSLKVAKMAGTFLVTCC